MDGDNKYFDKRKSEILLKKRVFRQGKVIGIFGKVALETKTTQMRLFSVRSLERLTYR